VSFAAPLVLLGLLVLPALAAWYLSEQQRRTRAAGAFVTVPMTASVAPRRPGWRRHAPIAVTALALALLIVAAARPQYRATVPVKGGTVMLVNDVSNSMTSTDVKPTRLGAAQKAAITFTNKVPTEVGVGSIEFARTPTLLQSPSTDHALARTAILQLKPGGGGTAMGEALETALAAIRTAPKVDGKVPPGAILLISDGGANVGVDPVTVAAAAKKAHVRIYTIAVGTSSGTMLEQKDGRSVSTPVPVEPTTLEQVATASGGIFYPAPDSAQLSAIYANLATKLGHTRVEKGLIAAVAGAGIVLLLIGGGVSLRWFGRLA
jgi:Ca-activated chloride channel homolog